MPPVGVNRVNWRASSYPDFIQNYFLLKRMFGFFDNRDKCRKPGSFRGNIYTSCISLVLLNHFANKSNTNREVLHLLRIQLGPLGIDHIAGNGKDLFRFR